MEYEFSFLFLDDEKRSYYSSSLEIVYVVVVVVTHFNFCKKQSMNLRQFEVVAIA